MSPRRKVRATDLAGNKNDPNLLKYFALFVIVGGFFIYYMIKWTGGENYDRFAKAKKYSEYYKEFFVETPIVYHVFGESKLVVRATNLGFEFWDKEFRSKVVQSENEVNEMLKIEEWLNTPDINNKFVKQKVNLSSFPEIYDLIEEGKKQNGKTLYNIASGEISDFWEIALKNYRIRSNALEAAKKRISYLYDDPLLSPIEAEKKKKTLESLTKEKTKVVDSIESVAAKIKAFKNEEINRLLDKALSTQGSISQSDKQALLISILQTMEIYSKANISPDRSSISDFMKYTSAENIELNSSEKSVFIKNVNTGIKLSFFKEALFLKKLKEKLPRENFNYLIFLGGRHGMWKLPPQFVRWTVSIDDPFAITDTVRGALKLVSEEGFFSITKKNEEVIIENMPEITKTVREDIKSFGDDRQKINEYVARLLKTYPPREYIFDPANITLSRKFDLPVDWRTGMPADRNMSALVIDNDPVRARMYSYSLFISDPQEIKSFSGLSPDTAFAVLKMDGTVEVPEKWKETFLTREQVIELKREYDKKIKGVDPSSPEKK